MSQRKSEDVLAEQMIRLCEVVGSETPDLLAYLVATLERSPSAPGLLSLARVWGIELVAVSKALGVGIRQLDEVLKPQPSRQTPPRWSRIEEVFGKDPANIAVLQDLTLARASRSSGSKHRRLIAAGRRMGNLRDHQERRRFLESFINEDESA